MHVGVDDPAPVQGRVRVEQRASEPSAAALQSGSTVGDARPHGRSRAHPRPADRDERLLVSRRARATVRDGPGPLEHRGLAPQGRAAAAIPRIAKELDRDLLSGVRAGAQDRDVGQGLHGLGNGEFRDPPEACCASSVASTATRKPSSTSRRSVANASSSTRCGST